MGGCRPGWGRGAGSRQTPYPGRAAGRRWRARWCSGRRRRAFRPRSRRCLGPRRGWAGRRAPPAVPRSAANLPLRERSSALPRGVARRIVAAAVCPAVRVRSGWPRASARCSRRARYESGRLPSRDELVLDRIVGDVGIRLEAHLLEDARAVGANGLHAKEELLGDLRNALAVRKLAENLELALGELRVRRLVRCGAREALRELVGDARAYIAPALRRGDDRRNEVLRRRILRDESRRSRLEHVDPVLVLRLAAHHY